MARFFKFTSHASKVKAHIRQVLENRLNAAAEHMQEELAITLLKPGPSSSGQPPGAITQQLADSIDWYAPERYQRNIGTPHKYGFWQEVGRATRLVPVNAKVLMIPVRHNVPGAVPIKRRSFSRRGRKFTRTFTSRRGNYRKRLEAVYPYVIFRPSAGPRPPKPWVKPTFLRNLKALARMIAHRID